MVTFTRGACRARIGDLGFDQKRQTPLRDTNGVILHRSALYSPVRAASNPILEPLSSPSDNAVKKMVKGQHNSELNESLRNPLWDKFVAPGISALKQQELKFVPRELRPDPLQFAVTAFLLDIKDPRTRVRVFNFVRRSQNAYDYYARARRAYSKLFRGNDFHWYLEALSQFENCLSAAYHGHEVLFGLRNRHFFVGDGDGRGQLNWRMNRLYNAAKHIEGMIRAQSFQGDNVAVWISNDGLQSKDQLIRFNELHEIVFDMSLSASILAKSHPWRHVTPPLLRKYAEFAANVLFEDKDGPGQPE